jgi:hypothetical protein
MLRMIFKVPTQAAPSPSMIQFEGEEKVCLNHWMEHDCALISCGLQVQSAHLSAERQKCHSFDPQRAPEAMWARCKL